MGHAPNSRSLGRFFCRALPGVPLKFIRTMSTRQAPPMDDHDDTPPPPPGPYYTDWGPPDGPPSATGIYEDPGCRVLPPTGIAYPVGRVRVGRGKAFVFKLVVRGVELEGRWIVVGWRFVKLGDAAELL
jgi:hypothetical protein